MTIVWPCRLSVDAYVAASRDDEFPRPDCPSCRTGLKQAHWVTGFRDAVKIR
jgi:hypothetical protein